MFHVQSDSPGQLLTMSYSRQVDAKEMQSCVQKVRDALAEMKPGFRLLTDLTGLETMELSCAPYLEEIMQLCDEKKVRTVLRVIPDPTKDIGFAIMSRFHYAPTVQFLTYDSLAEARQAL